MEEHLHNYGLTTLQLSTHSKRRERRYYGNGTSIITTLQPSGYRTMVRTRGYLTAPSCNPAKHHREKQKKTIILLIHHGILSTHINKGSTSGDNTRRLNAHAKELPTTTTTGLQLPRWDVSHRPKGDSLREKRERRCA